MTPHPFIILLLSILLTCVRSVAAPLWNPDSRTLVLGAAADSPWLAEGAAQIKLTGGQVISTRDPRFKVTAAQSRDRHILTGIDDQKIVDWELVVTELDPSSMRLDWSMINRSGKPLQLDRIDVLTGKLTGAADPAKNRALTSGLHSWDGGKMARVTPGAKLESHYTLALQSPPLAAGFLAGRHNLDRFELNHGTAGLEFTAYGECNQCILPPGATRAADPLFLSAGGNTLRQMEVFADLAARENGVRLWPENFATWCSWYAGWMRQEALFEFKEGLQRGVETNIPLVTKFLGTRGTPSMRVVDDSNEMPYGDWDNRTLAVPDGFQRLAGQIRDNRIMPGVWYPPFWVSTKSRLYQEHPEWLCHNENGQVAVGNDAKIPESMYGNHLAFLDASNPAAAARLEATARSWRDRGFRYIMTDFMYWGAWQKKRFDPTLTAVETYHRGLEAMRRGYGKDSYWLHCGALLGPAMGLGDGMRISGDSHGDAIFSYEAAAFRWFYNWRVWINDPDAIVCRRYGKTMGVEWNRAWMSWMALAGNVLTYGDTLDDLPKEFLDLYQKIMPPLPVAGRPLDLWENDPYLIWGMEPGVADGPYTLFGVFELQGRRTGEHITLNLDEVAARSRAWDQAPKESPATWLLWDFWKQRLTKVNGPHLTVPVPSKSCGVYALRPDLGRPQLLGTSGHFSQGTLETKDVKWNEKTASLTGKARGNGGDPTTLFFHLPGDMKCTAATVAFVVAEPRIIAPNVLALDIPAAPDEPVTIELRFSGEVGKAATRPFAGGLVGELKKQP